MSDAREAAAKAFQEYEHSSQELHRKLAALPQANPEKLQRAIEQHKKTAKAFQDDALECWKA